MYSNISSINANSTWMNASANNVANINTNKFTPIDTLIEGDNSGNPKATLRSSSSAGTDTSSGTNLAKEMTDQMVIGDSTAFNASAIKTEDSMTKTLLDIKV